MAQEGAQWPSVMIILGLHWPKVKLKRISSSSSVVVISYKLTAKVCINENYNWHLITSIHNGTKYVVVWNKLAGLCLELSQFGAS